MIYCIGDQHISPVGEYSPLRKGYTSENLELFDKTFDFIEADLDARLKQGEFIEFIIFMGDMGDDNGNINPVAQEWITRRICRFVLKYTGRKIPVKFLVGNHEMFDIDGEICIIGFLEHFSPLCEVIRHPKIEEDIAFIPYLHKKRLWQALPILNEKSVNTAFTHLDFLGASMTPKIRSNVGVDIGEITNDVEIVNGHYHCPEIINLIAGGRVINVGALYHRDHSDSLTETPRGVMLYKERGETTWLENPYTDYFNTIRSPEREKIIEQARNIREPERTRLKIFTTSLEVINKEELVEEIGIEFKSVKLFRQIASVVDPDEIETVERISVEDAVEQCVEEMTTELDKGRLKDICKTDIIEHEDL